MHLPNDTLLQGGKYRIIRLISEGDFGCTYEAENVALGKRVVIKEFFVKELCYRDEETSQVAPRLQSKKPLVLKLKTKFVDEATALSQFKHPNVIKVFDVFEENDTAYYVMEYIDGVSLADLIKSKYMLNEDETISVVKQICSGLDYIHSKNRLHLDINPSNIMTRTNGEVVLIDFGSAKQYDEDAGVNTSTLTVKNPGYTPIEQMDNHTTQFTPSTDIYPLGAIMVKMLTGVTPPDATIIEEEGIPELPQSIPDAVVETITASLQQNPAHRPQSIEEFISYLEGRKKFVKITPEVSDVEQTLADTDLSAVCVDTDDYTEDNTDDNTDELLRQISEYKERLANAQTDKRSLQDKYNKSVCEIAQLKTSRDNLESEVKALEEQQEDLKKHTNPIWLIISGVLLIACIALFAKCSSDSETITQLYESEDNLKSQLSQSQSDLSKCNSEITSYKNILSRIGFEQPFFLSSFKIRDTADKFGDPILSRTATYLCPQVDIIGLLPDGNYEFKIKIFSPYGLVPGKDAPAGYSFADNLHLNQYQQNTVDIQDRGYEQKGMWSPGNYRYEFYYKGKCVGKFNFRIQ